MQNDRCRKCSRLVLMILITGTNQTKDTSVMIGPYVPNPLSKFAINSFLKKRSSVAFIISLVFLLISMGLNRSVGPRKSHGMALKICKGNI